MAKIQVHYGTYLNLDIRFDPTSNTLFLPKQGAWKTEAMPLSSLRLLEIASEENVRAIDPNWDLREAKSRIHGTTMWGAAFGILGIVGETLVKGADITFVAQFDDGRAFLGTMGANAFEKMQSGFNSLPRDPLKALRAKRIEGTTANIHGPVNVNKESTIRMTSRDSISDEQSAPNSVAEDAFFTILEIEGISKAKSIYQQSREKNPNALVFSESRMNKCGYTFFRNGKLDFALDVFSFNAEVYPESPNCLASMADVYKVMGNIEDASRHYRKALELFVLSSAPATEFQKALLENIKENLANPGTGK